jgi:cellulose synthase/poly-beta-1,6-N-acetylglucosamine synthase-like glycosyltransferase
VIRFLDFSNHVVFWYYLASNIAYLVMLLVAFRTSAAHQRLLESHDLHWVGDTPLAPPVTIIAPAHNEEGSIRIAVRNLLQLDHARDQIKIFADAVDPIAPDRANQVRAKQPEGSGNNHQHISLPPRFPADQERAQVLKSPG